MPIAQQRHDQEKAAKAAAHAAHLATLPSMGAGQFAAFCRAWAAFVEGGGDAERMQAIRYGQAPDDNGCVLRPMQGKEIARALTELEVPTYHDTIRKWYSSEWRPHQDLGWHIWGGEPITKFSSDERSHRPYHSRFCMDSDGTVRERKPRYGINDRYTGTTVVNVISADIYWSRTVLRYIAEDIGSFPGKPLAVLTREGAERPYADRADAWRAE